MPVDVPVELQSASPEQAEKLLLFNRVIKVEKHPRGNQMHK